MRALVRMGLPLVVSGFAVVAGGFTAPALAAPDPAAQTKQSARRLEDIHIEGEVPVPQVLFITGRDQRRFLEFRHKEYQQSGVEVGRAAVLPSHFQLVGIPPSTVRKEIAP